MRGVDFKMHNQIYDIKNHDKNILKLRPRRPFYVERDELEAIYFILKLLAKKKKKTE